MDNSSKAASLVSEVILGTASKKLTVHGKEYSMCPPTIYKIAGAVNCLSSIEWQEGYKGVVNVMQHLTLACDALSIFLNNDTSLSAELSEGTLSEINAGLTIALHFLSIREFNDVVNFGEEKDDVGSKSKTIGNDTLVGQIASFMEALSLSYHEVVYEIPYRTLLLMSKDKARVAVGEVYHETTDEDFFKEKGITLGK